jgi:WD40 repeat protein
MFVADATNSAPGRSLVLLDRLALIGDHHFAFAADSNRVRRIGAFGGRDDDSDFPMGSSVLSPDGRLIAIGNGSTDGHDVLILDLVTGAERRYAVPNPDSWSIEAVAWSPRSDRLVVVTDSLFVLDVTSGATTKIATRDLSAGAGTDLLPGETPLPGATDATSAEPDPADSVAAFAPDGKTIAYDDGVTIELYPADGNGGPTLVTDKLVSLAGPDAWAPDGKSLLVTRDESDADQSTSLLSIDVATKLAKRLDSFTFDDFSSPTPVGWRAADEVLLSGLDPDGALLVDAYGLDGKRRDRVVDYGSSAVAVQFASGLLAGATARSGGHESGPTPAGWRWAIGLAAGLGTVVVFLLVGFAIGAPALFRRRREKRERRERSRLVRPPGSMPAGVPAWPGAGAWPGPGYRPSVGRAPDLRSAPPTWVGATPQTLAEPAARPAPSAGGWDLPR